MAGNTFLAGARPSLSPRLGVACALVICVTAFWPTWAQWAAASLANPQYEHGPVLAAISLLLLLRDTPVDGPSQRPWWWLVALAAASLGWVVSWLAGIAVAAQVLVVACGWLLIRTGLGRAAGRAAALPVLWLLFASELWEYAAPPLQLLTAGSMNLLLGAASFPVHVEGAHVSVPAGDFVIEEGCSGVKYLITMLALACLIVRLGRFRLAARAWILGAALVLAILANWIRVAALVLIGEATHLQHPLIHDHYLFGWVLFVAALVPLVFIVRHLQKRPGASRSELPTPPAREPPRLSPFQLMASFAAALCGPALALLVAVRGSSAMESLPPPSLVQVIAAEGAGEVPLRLARSGAPGGPFSQYESPAGAVEFAAYSLRLPIRSDALQELLETAKGGGKPVTLDSHTAALTGTGGNVIRFSETQSTSPSGGLKIVRFWFENGGESFARSSTAKVTTALRALVGVGQLKIFVVKADCTSDCRVSQRLLDGFMRGLQP